MNTPVWLLASQFAPRGRSIYTLRLASHLPQFGFDPTIICESAAEVPDRYRRKLKIREIPRLTHPLFRWAATRKLEQEFTLNPPALIHAQRRSLDALSIDLADRFSRPYLLTVHEILQSKETVAVLPERLAGVIAVSPSVERDLVVGAAFPAERVHVIPTGVEIPADPRLPAVRSLDDVPLVGCACALDPSKGVSYFLMAAELILSSGQDVEFLVAGSGPEERTLRRIAQHLDVANRVTFATHVHEYQYILESLDVFVLPSLSQGIGSIMLEAMALGKPVVATKTGGVVDYLTDEREALLVPPANHVLLAEKIQEVLDNPERARRIAAAGQQLVRGRFTAEQMAQSTADLYRQVLAGSTSRAPAT